MLHLHCIVQKTLSLSQRCNKLPLGTTLHYYNIVVNDDIPAPFKTQYLFVMCMTNMHEDSFILSFIALKDLSFIHSAKTKGERDSVALHKYTMIHKIQRQKTV